MKTLLLLLLAISMFGCVPMDDPSPPKRKRNVRPFVTTIIVACRNGCEPCERQMKTLSAMRGIDARKVNHSTCSTEDREDYPATSFPTLYIYKKSGVKIIAGYQSEEQIRHLIQ